MIEILGYVVLGWLMYVLISAWITLQNIKGAVNEVVERKMIDAAVDKHVLIARMEPVEQGEYNVVLAYNHSTNKFLGQAATQEQVEEMLKEKYPKMNIIVVNEKATIESVNSSVDVKSV
jgi:hypothetical protein